MHTQYPLTKSVRLKSSFTLHDASKEIIADQLTYDQIKPISDSIDGSVIKFDRMVCPAKSHITQIPQSKYSVTFFQVIKIDGRALSPRFETRTQAVNAKRSILSNDAVISEQTLMFQSKDDVGRAGLLAEIASNVVNGEFDVSCFQVIHHSEFVLSRSLSPRYGTEEQALMKLELIKNNYPTAKISKQTFVYSSLNDYGRAEILAEIQQA